MLLVLGAPGRLLDVGCGTGSLAAALAERGFRVWGVDASPEMVAAARAKSVAAKRARAESLPFKGSWFDRVVFQLVAHLVDRPQAFAEAHRVLADGGRIAVVTFAPEHFAGFYLNRLFPSILRIDGERFPAPEQLTAELTDAGFDPPRFTEHRREVVQSRDDVLERIRARHISTLELIPQDEYEEGLARAERELPDPVRSTRNWLIAAAAARGAG